MTNIKQSLAICTSGDQADWTLYSPKVEVELEKLDCQTGHQYLPMDVYVDPKTIKEHFQASSIRDRLTRLQGASS
jgi:hypothetical protein